MYQLFASSFTVANRFRSLWGYVIQSWFLQFWLPLEVNPIPRHHQQQPWINLESPQIVLLIYSFNYCDTDRDSQPASHWREAARRLYIVCLRRPRWFCPYGQSVTSLHKRHVLLSSSLAYRVSGGGTFEHGQPASHQKPTTRPGQFRSLGRGTDSSLLQLQKQQLQHQQSAWFLEFKSWPENSFKHGKGEIMCVCLSRRLLLHPVPIPRPVLVAAKRHVGMWAVRIRCEFPFLSTRHLYTLFACWGWILFRPQISPVII